jgi:hypothetical protein
MEFGEIFSNALKYPLSDFQKLLIVGAVFLLSSLTSVLAQFGFYNMTLSLIWNIVSIVITILLIGYGLSVLKTGIDLEDEIPDFDWAKNLVDGIKCVVVSFLYFLIPAIVTGIVAFALGYGPLTKILTQENLAAFASGNSTQVNAVMGSIPPEVWSGLGTAILVTVAVGILLFIIFGIFAEIGVCRLAKYDSLGEAFSFGKIWGDIKEIGILKVLGFLIVLSILASIIGVVVGFISSIPFLGVIIGCLVGNSFLLLFSNRAVGLLYSEI